MFLKNFAKLTESYRCRLLLLNKVDGFRLKKNSGAGALLWILRNFSERLFSLHMRTAASVILGYPLTKSRLKKYTVFSSIWVFIHFKLIIESCTTSRVYLVPYQKPMMQNAPVSIFGKFQIRLCSTATFFWCFCTFFVWILEWTIWTFCFSSESIQLLCSHDLN